MEARRLEERQRVSVRVSRGELAVAPRLGPQRPLRIDGARGLARAEERLDPRHQQPASLIGLAPFRLEPEMQPHVVAPDDEVVVTHHEFLKAEDVAVERACPADVGRRQDRNRLFKECGHVRILAQNAPRPQSRRGRRPGTICAEAPVAQWIEQRFVRRGRVLGQVRGVVGGWLGRVVGVLLFIWQLVAGIGSHSRRLCNGCY
jgi:hypothetical protein